MRPDQCHGHKENSPAPLRFALVPVEPIERPSFCDHGLSKGCCSHPFKREYCCADAEQSERDASPGNHLLQRIVRARDNLDSVKSSRASETCDVIEAIEEMLSVLGELDHG